MNLPQKKYVYSNNNQIDEFLSFVDYESILLISNKGYKYIIGDIYNLNNENLSIQSDDSSAYFESSNCTGQMSIAFAKVIQNRLVGHVFSKTMNGVINMYYIPYESFKETLNTGSFYNGSCSGSSGSSERIKVYLNDLSITGVHNNFDFSYPLIMF